MPIQPKQQPPYYTEISTVKKYIALLSQSGTDAPTATILQNTLNATPVWTRIATGIYKCELTGAFPINKTTLLPQQNDLQADGITYMQNDQNQGDFILVRTVNDTFTNVDEALDRTAIEITIYP